MGDADKDNYKEQDKATMAIIATTTKDGVDARLSADFQIDVGKVYYTVSCAGYTFEFGEFALAARVYKTFSRRIEMGMTKGIDVLVRNVASAVRVMGYAVKGGAQ